MPFFENSDHTDITGHTFNEVAGNQYEYITNYPGDDRLTRTIVATQADNDAYYGVIKGGIVGGTGNYYGDAPRTATASSTTQQRLRLDSASAVDVDELGEATLALDRRRQQVQKLREREDKLDAELVAAKAKLSIAERMLAAAQKELARCKVPAITDS